MEMLLAMDPRLGIDLTKQKEYEKVDQTNDKMHLRNYNWLPYSQLHNAQAYYSEILNLLEFEKRKRKKGL